MNILEDLGGQSKYGMYKFAFTIMVAITRTIKIFTNAGGAGLVKV